MLHLYYGTDRKKVRDALNSTLEKMRASNIIRITDAHTIEDLRAALGGGGLFDDERTIVLESTLAHDFMRPLVIDALSRIADAHDTFHLFEEKIDAATKRRLEKHAEKSTVFDLPKGAARPAGRPGFNVFSLADALKRKDKKNLWIGYQRALAAGNAAESIHGIFFWAAKDMLLKARSDSDTVWSRSVIRTLMELPHESRRRGEDMEYALERFVLSLA